MRKTRKFFITCHDPSRRAMPPFSYSSPCTSLPTLVPITPLALQLRRRSWGQPLAMDTNTFHNAKHKYKAKYIKIDG